MKEIRWRVRSIWSLIALCRVICNTDLSKIFQNTHFLKQERERKKFITHDRYVIVYQIWQVDSMNAYSKVMLIN